MNHLPFFRKTLLLFGDHVLVKPTPMTLRKQLLDISLKRNWSPATTLAKLMFDIELDIVDPYTLAICRSL